MQLFSIFTVYANDFEVGVDGYYVIDTQDPGSAQGVCQHCIIELLKLTIDNIDHIDQMSIWFSLTYSNIMLLMRNILAFAFLCEASSYYLTFLENFISPPLSGKHIMNSQIKHYRLMTFIVPVRYWLG